MTRVLLLAALVGFTASAAGACEFQKSVQAKEVDQTVVASVDKAAPAPMSTTDDALPAKPPVIVEQAVE